MPTDTDSEVAYTKGYNDGAYRRPHRALGFIPPWIHAHEAGQRDAQQASAEKIAQLNNDIIDNDNASRKRIEQLQTSEDELCKKIEELTADVQALDINLDFWKTGVSAKQAEIDRLKAEITELQEENS